jgi:hypothetical protein
MDGAWLPWLEAAGVAVDCWLPSNQVLSEYSMSTGVSQG